MLIAGWSQLLREQNLLNVLSLLAVAMIMDFLSGLLAAKMNHEIVSKVGINGILRKVASMILLVFFLPIAFLIPGSTGVAMLYVLYLGYLFLELQSILENYEKMGVDVNPFMKFIHMLKEFMESKK